MQISKHKETLPAVDFAEDDPRQALAPEVDQRIVDATAEHIDALLTEAEKLFKRK